MSLYNIIMELWNYHEGFLYLHSYEIMLDCWNADPSKRPTFSDLVVSLTTQLERMAGYLDLTVLQNEACVTVEEDRLYVPGLEVEEMENDEKPSGRYVTTPL